MMYGQVVGLLSVKTGGTQSNYWACNLCVWKVNCYREFIEKKCVLQFLTDNKIWISNSKIINYVADVDVAFATAAVSSRLRKDYEMPAEFSPEAKH